MMPSLEITAASNIHVLVLYALKFFNFACAAALIGRVFCNAKHAFLGFWRRRGRNSRYWEAFLFDLNGLIYLPIVFWLIPLNFEIFGLLIFYLLYALLRRLYGFPDTQNKDMAKAALIGAAAAQRRPTRLH